jgi:hypothetical protein
LTIIATAAAAVIAAPVVGPYVDHVVAAAVVGVAGVAAHTARKVVHNNNMRAVREIEYRERRDAYLIEGPRSRTGEYLD